MKKTALDIGSYDTCERPQLGRDFLKMRQWLCARHVARLRVADRIP
jgi:hypothetical protein